MKGLFTSPRFWLIVVIAVLQSLAVFNILSGEQVKQLVDIISLAIGGVIAVRTADKFSEPKPNTTTVTIPTNVSEVTAKTKKKK